MIIIGYQGIGKSTLSKQSDHYIDLESGCFWNGGIRPSDWYVYYGNIAEHLSDQGYVVFVSSHAEVRERLKNTKSVYAIVPAVELQEEWIEKLRVRWEQSGLEKDYKAYMNATSRYEDNIGEIKADIKHCIEIKGMAYELKSMVKILENQEREEE